MMVLVWRELWMWSERGRSPGGGDQAPAKSAGADRSPQGTGRKTEVSGVQNSQRKGPEGGEAGQTVPDAPQEFRSRPSWACAVQVTAGSAKAAGADKLEVEGRLQGPGS